ncbi:MAG TPA: DUF885 domain-containing protein [Gemmatimonadaceae bacterium]|nr:DUF885 domain-containing protein [Gemmatimonadaceae bacterium]
MTPLPAFDSALFAAPADTSDAALTAHVGALADAYMASMLAHAPELGTLYGIPGSRHDRLPDNSPAALAAWHAREDSLLDAVRAVDSARVDRTGAWITYGLLREALEASVGTRICRHELWGVSQFSDGWPSAFATLAAAQPVGTDTLRAQALARWGELPHWVDTEITNLQEGMRLGYTAPRGNVRLVIAQIDSILATPLEESPFYEPATRDSSFTFRSAMRALVTSEIAPALRRYRDFLELHYLPAARETIAVSALPDGAACYQALVRSHTSLDVPARDIHELGVREVAATDSAMRVIAERSFGTSDVGELLAALRTDPRYTFQSRDEIVAYASAALARARAAAPQWFGRLPRADVKIERYPAFRERSASGEYIPPAEDGSRPGIFYIATYDPATRSRAGIEAVTFHETIPGHHLQIALALERGDAVHPIARYLGSAGFIEGWALYAESLADEMGLYTGDLDRLGMLSERAWRAARLVVDPGIHMLGWSRQQAIDYLLAHTAVSPDEAASEVDRYIVAPGQATAYMLGAITIRDLRERAEHTLGSDFDVRAFHDRVLENGNITLPMLRHVVDRWLAASRP